MTQALNPCQNMGCGFTSETRGKPFPDIASEIPVLNPFAIGRYLSKTHESIPGAPSIRP